MAHAARILLKAVTLCLLSTATANVAADPLWLSYDASPLRSSLDSRPEPFLGFPVHKPESSEWKPPGLSLGVDPRLKTAISVSLLSAGLYVAVDQKSRDWVKMKWEFIFSPNHAQAANKGPFRFRTHQEELSQISHIDKWCHFVFAYLPFEPLTIYSQRFLEGLPRWLGGTENNHDPSGKAVFLSAVIVTGGSVLEEYLDGFQKDEGFSVHDLACNLAGVTLGILKQNGHLNNLRVHWRFTGTPKNWRYPWFDYMPGYATVVMYDFSELIFGKKDTPEPPTAKLVRCTGYLPTHREEDREIYPWVAPIW